MPRAFLLAPASTSSVPPGGAPLSLRFAGALPNPMRAGGAFGFALPRSGDARLDLFDTAGRRVRALSVGAFGAGEHRVNWDGRDEAGHALEPGTYFARLQTDGTALARAFVVIR